MIAMSTCSMRMRVRLEVETVFLHTLLQELQEVARLHAKSNYLSEVKKEEREAIRDQVKAKIERDWETNMATYEKEVREEYHKKIRSAESVKAQQQYRSRILMRQEARSIECWSRRFDHVAGRAKLKHKLVLRKE